MSVSDGEAWRSISLRARAPEWPDVDHYPLGHAQVDGGHLHRSSDRPVEA